MELVLALRAQIGEKINRSLNIENLETNLKALLLSIKQEIKKYFEKDMKKLKKFVLASIYLNPSKIDYISKNDKNKVKIFAFGIKKIFERFFWFAFEKKM